MMKEYSTTLLFIIKNENILLAEKKRGFGVGKVNGVGGKLEKNETVEDAMLRETMEEINVTPLNYRQVGLIDCRQIKDGLQELEHMYIYIANDFNGEITESEEMRPKWYKINEIPYNQMWDGDKLWVKDILSGKNIHAEIEFDENFKLKEYKIIEVIDGQN